MPKVILLALSLIFIPHHASAVYARMAPSLRAYPLGGTIEGMLGQDWYLYDDRNPKEFWKFGLVNLRLKGALHGFMESTLSVYPISFVKLYFGLGGSYRYYNSTGYDCLQNICQGFLNRSSIGFSFAFNFGDQGEFLLVPNYKSVAVSHSQTNKKILDETELLLAAAGGDTLDQVSLFIGKTLMRGRVIGIYLKQSQYRNSLKQNEMQLLMMNWDWKTSTFTLGAGRYASDFHTPGVTLTAEYEWKWGESLALF